MDVHERWRSYATVCRLCMQKDGFMLGIFNHMQEKEKNIYKKIRDCTALQISFGDGLPNVICHRCLYKIEFCLEFRQLCFMSDAALRQISTKIMSSKDNGFNSIIPHQLPLLQQLAKSGSNEEVVMVVDPTAPDYDSEYETENERQSDNDINETNDSFECRNVSLCKYCDKAFTDKQECSKHESSIHNSEIPYSCNECNMQFTDRGQYSAHLKNVHQNEKPYNCPQCDKTFARRSDLRKHTIVHTGVKPFTCTTCFKSFSRNTNLSKHMRIHLSQKPFVCTKCPKTFSSKIDLNRHAIIHIGQKPFSCHYCSLTFIRRDKLLRHEKRHFPEENSEDKSKELQVLRQNLMGNYNYGPSNNTGENCTNSENMVISIDPFNHDNYRNGESTKSEADVLDIEDDRVLEPEGNSNDFNNPTVDATDTNTFPLDNKSIINSSSDSLKSNWINTNNIKRFSCCTCKKKFSTPENLRYHQASHSGVRPFSCNICGKTFIRKRELDRHEATHTGMKPFECNKCNKRFGRKDKLVRHMRIHDVNKEFTCEICFTVFNRKDGLISHMKTHFSKSDEVDEKESEVV